MSLEQAIAFAAAMHAEQKDKQGRPYILHVMRVVLSQSDPINRIIAALHDVVEDTNVTLRELLSAGFSGEVVEAVDALTRREGEQYQDYIQRLDLNQRARSVKLGDLADHMHEGPGLPEDEWRRLRPRYVRAVEYLTRNGSTERR